METKIKKRIIQLLNKEGQDFIQGNAIIDLRPFLDQMISINDIFYALNHKEEFDGKLDNVEYITAIQLRYSMPYLEPESSLLDVLNIFIENSQYCKFDSIILNNKEIDNVEETLKILPKLFQENKILETINTIKIDYIDLKTLLEITNYIAQSEHLSNIKCIKLEKCSLSASDLLILENSTDILIEQKAKVDQQIYILLKKFYNKLKSIYTLEESYVEKAIKDSCSAAKASDGHDFPYLKGLRILSEFPWQCLNFQGIPGILKSLYKKQEVKSESYHLQAEDTLHFYMVKINGGNVQPWLDYLKNQENLAAAHCNSRAVKKSGIGITGGLTCLEYYDSDNTEVWFAFAADKKCNPKSINYSAIEMFVTMTTSEHAPFTMHMGIARAASYNGEKHHELSMKLHSFIAQATLQDHIDKYYMITRPANIMANIFTDSCRKSETPFLLYMGSGDKVEYPKENLEVLRKIYDKMKEEGFYDRMNSVAAEARLKLDLKLQEEDLNKGIIYIPIQIEYDDHYYMTSFLLKKDTETVLCNLSLEDINGEFKWFCGNTWILFEEAYAPIITTDLKGLSGLFTFNGTIEHIESLENIGDIMEYKGDY